MQKKAFDLEHVKQNWAEQQRRRGLPSQWPPAKMGGAPGAPAAAGAAPAAPVVYAIGNRVRAHWRDANQRYYEARIEAITPHGTYDLHCTR